MSLATPTSKDLNQVYQGFQSLPKPYNFGKGFEIKTWNKNRTISTPFYGDEFVEEYYKEIRNSHVVLELPVDIKDQVGSGSLQIELEIDTREEEGWEEQVKVYSKPPEGQEGYIATHLDHAFKVHPFSKSWRNAEAICQREGGGLASVYYTAEENDELSKILGYQRETVYAIDFSTSGFHNQKGNSITYACQRYDDAFCIESPPLLFHS